MEINTRINTKLAISFCKIHGTTEFYINKKKNIPHFCQKCTVAKRLARLDNPITRKNDIDYIKNYIKSNPDKAEQYYIDSINKHRTQRNTQKLEFYTKYDVIINDIVNILKIKHTTNKLYKINNVCTKILIDTLLKYKYSELTRQTRWSISADIKYDKLKSYNLNNATEKQKIEIRHIYKNEAKLIVDTEIQKYRQLLYEKYNI